MSNVTKVAAVSMHCQYNKATNVKKYLHYIEEAAMNNVKLILFPELSLQGPPTSMLSVDPEEARYQYENAELIPQGETTQLLIRKAKEYHMYISWGMTEQDPERIDVMYNSCVLVGPEGYVGHYRKVHQPMTERLYFFPGNDYKIYDTELGKIGMMICFDKAFPEPARALAIQGAQIILCPTAWPSMNRSEHDPALNQYRIFDQARAMENMVYVVCSNHVGSYLNQDPLGLCGNSHVVDPFGTELCTTGYDEGMAIAEIDIQGGYICARLNSMNMTNLIKDRRPDTYGKLTEVTEYSLMNGKGVLTNGII